MIVKKNISKTNRNKQINQQTFINQGTTIYNEPIQVIDNLVTEDTNAALSANQGKILNERHDIINVSRYSGISFYTINEAVNWALEHKAQYNFDFHNGVRIRFREWHRGKWLTYVFNQWNSTDYSNANNWVTESTDDVINVTADTDNCPKGINEAVKWLVNDKEKYGYNLHIGMTLKFRDYNTGQWLSYIYRGSNSDWRSKDFINPNNWYPTIIDNLTTDSHNQSLSARQGKVLNEVKPSKNKPETITGLYTFQNGMISNGTIAIGGFATDDTKGIGLYKSGSDWNGTFDNITVRKRMNVNELKVEQAKYIGGKLFCTMAGVVINKVENYGHYYKCYFNSNTADGIKINNQFSINDLAFCQTFNNNGVRRWWRMVDEVGENYIELSDLDGEKEIGSDIPEPGDTIVQLGNFAYPERQGALVIEPLAINIYEGINDFKLPEPKVVLAPNGTKIDADDIDFIGKTTINGNFAVDEKGDISLNNATLRGKIEAESGYFKGLVRNGEVHITPDNLNYYTKDSGFGDDSLVFDFDKISPLVYFDGDYKNANLVIYFPSNKTARELVGKRIILYNSATNLTLTVSGPIYENGSGPKSILLNNNSCNSLTCDFGFMRSHNVEYADKEVINWVLERGTQIK